MSVQIRNADSVAYKNKLSWVKTLQVGDTICDCRLQHVRISQIENDTVVRMPRWFKNIIFANWMPYRIGNLLDDAFSWISRKIGNIELVDRLLILEGGAHCSAMHCCDPSTHEFNHDSE